MKHEYTVFRFMTDFKIPILKFGASLFIYAKGEGGGVNPDLDFLRLITEKLNY